MSVLSGAGAFPNSAAPVYGTPIFPSTITASQWNAMAQYQQPAPGSVSGSAVVNRPGSNSWQSDVPVEGQVRLVRGKTEWTRYIEAGDQIFAIVPHKASRKIELEGAVMGFNLYTANRWLRERHAEAITILRTDPVNILDNPEWHQVAQIEEKTNLEKNTALRYLTVDTILKEMTYLGVNNTQSNELKSLDQRNGHNISASYGEPMVVFGTRGPHRMRNVWGSDALPGRHLWIILKRWAPKAGELSQDRRAQLRGAGPDDPERVLALSEDRPFQLVPHVAERWESTIPDEKRVYDGLGGYLEGEEFKHYQERGHAFYVGQVLMTAHRTAIDSSPTMRDASGLASLNEDENRVERPAPSSVTSYEDTQALEYFQVQVNPQAFGSFVILA